MYWSQIKLVSDSAQLMTVPLYLSLSPEYTTLDHQRTKVNEQQFITFYPMNKK